MENLNIILKCIAVVFIAIGVICIYDARKLTEKFFSKKDINSVTRMFKIIGAVISIVGCAIILF